MVKLRILMTRRQICLKIDGRIADFDDCVHTHRFFDEPMLNFDVQIAEIDGKFACIAD